MSDQDSQEIQTGGGAYLAGDVDIEGGDFVGRDKIIQHYQLDVEKLVNVLREALPDDDPMPQHLLDTLHQFQYFHTRLHEWKELHNGINDITIALGQFLREVERLDISQERVVARSLSRLWRPVAQKVTILLDWATTIKFIAETPFSQSESGLKGPKWAIELHVARTRVDECLHGGDVDTHLLYDATYDFDDAAERHMYQADKQLRQAAGELYTLSRIVLGSLAHEDHV